MISSLFHAVIYQPLYNGLIALVDIVPNHDIGLAIILLTIAVRFILFPLSRQAVRTQKAMRDIAPELEAIKTKYKDSQEEQARATFALYREKNIRPFASFFLVLIQLPILIALYWVFGSSGLPAVNADLLYSVVPVPSNLNIEFLGLIDMTAKHSIALAFLAALAQAVYARLSMGPRKKSQPATSPSFANDMARSMDVQMRYVLPVFIGVFAYSLAAAVPLYWVTSTSFMIAQEFFMGRRFKE